MPKKKDTGFQKGNDRGFTTERSAPLDRRPFQLLLPGGLRDRVMAIDGWRDEIRIMLSQWVEEKEAEDPGESR